MFCNAITAINSKGGFLNEHSFIMSWYLIGPFQFRSTADRPAGRAIHHEFMSPEKIPPLHSYAWRFSGGIGEKNLGDIDLNRIFGTAASDTAAYAVTLLWAPEELHELQLLTGSDDYIKVWINGRLVHTYNMAARTGRIDQDKVPYVRLNQGYNLIVVKVVNIDRDWDFFFRLADGDGSPIEFHQQTITGEEWEDICREIERKLLE